jgi:hypothetical protein
LATSEIRTEALCDAYNALLTRAFSTSDVKRKFDICFDNSPSIVINIDEYRKGDKKIKGPGGKISMPHEIMVENLNYCKQLATLVDALQHIIGVNGGVINNEL